MNKTIKDLIDVNSPYSSMRWVMVTCVRWGIALAVLSIVGFLALTMLGKDIDSGFLGGSASIIGLVIGIPSISKAAQYFGEKEHHPEESGKEDNEQGK